MPTLPAAMSAVVCGKRSLFDDIHGSPPVTKRLRCGGGSSPIRFSSGSLWRSGLASGPFETSSLQHISAEAEVQLSHLRVLFPEMDEQLLEKVLQNSGYSLDSAIKSLNELHLSPNGRTIYDTSAEVTSERGQGFVVEDDGSQSVPVEVADTQNHNQTTALASEGSEWVELFVQDMLRASNLDDARDRAARALEAFEKTVVVRTGSMFEVVQKENATLKEQLQCMLRDNHILKRAVAIQHERQLEHENCSQEVQRLKQLVAQYQEQIRTLELNNYALGLHLRRAQEGSSMPGNFHPDVF